MKRFLILAGLLLNLNVPSWAEEEPPEFTPDGRGGFNVVFRPAHLENRQFGEINTDGFTVPRAPTYRGCVYSTPVIPVFHQKGKQDLTILLRAKWVGFLDPVQGEEADLFTVFVRVENEAEVKIHREWMHTGLMHKEGDYVGPDGRIHYIATTEGWMRLHMHGIDVEQDDEVTLEVCDVRPGAGFSTSRISVHSYPLHQGGNHE